MKRPISLGPLPQNLAMKLQVGTVYIKNQGCVHCFPYFKGNHLFNRFIYLDVLSFAVIFTIMNKCTFHMF